MDRYLCLYAQEHPNFRLTELESILDIHKIKANIEKEEHDLKKPFLVIHFSCIEDIKLVLSRSVLLRYVIRLFGQGSSIEEMLKLSPGIHQIAKSFVEDKESTFCFKVEAFNKKISMEEKKLWIEDLESKGLDFGRADLVNPTHSLHLLMDFDGDKATKALNQLYFGELVGNGQRSLIQQYSLKTRYFIGNTSMDPQLSFIMANQGKIEKGSIVYDPFVGTGSILTCCAHFGAITAGSDIDYSIIYGRGKSSRAGQQGWRAKDEIVRTNYQNYGLLSQYLDVMAADVSRLPFRSMEIFDAIITDPPYGIREGGRKQSSSKVASESASECFPAIEKQGLSGVIVSLIECAAKYLVVGGRLVFWLPVYRPSYTDDVIPTHPCLQLIANSEQPLTKKISRRLVTMEKICSLETNQMHFKSETRTHLPEELRLLHDQFRNNYFSVDHES